MNEEEKKPWEETTLGKLEAEARPKLPPIEKEKPKLTILEKEEIADKTRAVRLRETRRLLEAIGCWELANTGERIRLDWDEVKEFLVTDRPVHEIEDQSFLTTLKRQLILLYKQGYPLVEAHQRKQFPYAGKTGDKLPIYILELEFVKTREVKPLKFKVYERIPPEGIKYEAPEVTKEKKEEEKPEKLKEPKEVVDARQKI